MNNNEPGCKCKLCLFMQSKWQTWRKGFCSIFFRSKHGNAQEMRQDLDHPNKSVFTICISLIAQAMNKHDKLHGICYFFLVWHFHYAVQKSAGVTLLCVGIAKLWRTWIMVVPSFANQPNCQPVSKLIEFVLHSDEIYMNTSLDVIP